jgi:VWFA-related protein
MDFIKMRIYFLSFVCAAALMGQPTVRMDVEVVDKFQMLSGFQKEDFEVFDQKRKQQIVSFSQDSGPLDLILMVDVTSGVEANVSKVLQGAHAASAELHEGDRVAVISFSEKSTLVAPFTGDMSAVEKALANDLVETHAILKRVLPSVDDAVGYFLKEPNEHRRAILVVTGVFGVPTGSPDLITRHLLESDVLLNGLYVQANLKSRLLTAAPAVVPGYALVMDAGKMSHIRVAARTGGDTLSGGDPSVALIESIKRIRQRYSLVYARPQGKPGQQRSIEVKLSADAQKRNPHAKVLARTGYWIPKS